MKYDPIRIEEIRAAQKRIAIDIIRTPLVKLNIDDAPAEIYLKLENLQPVRSFKIRPASNALRSMDKKQLENGVWTVSAGNFSQGLAWMAKKLNVKCTVALSENTPQTKIEKTEKLGADVRKLPSSEALNIYWSRTYPGIEGVFIHPSNDPAVMAGGGTIGLEIVEDLPDVDTILVPWGCGGFTCGVASAVKALKPNVKVIACEIETNVKLGNALKPDEIITDGRRQLVFPELVDLYKKIVDRNLIVSLKETAESIKLMIERNCVVSEGRGGVSVAAALSGRAGKGKIACIVTGGNIEPEKLVQIFEGKLPNLWE